ncbi:peptide methionine sulfoxide reductase [Anaeramoeba flamelloides]|uniref:peptide-methionine (S)-S-oxide reductase n=1 Tax=Anaeramoeba flamelloides TaxID=1746091 RepID=A0AAV7Z5Z9_9EUKA|nr:peptide methionine sulfoxide reductase [Anaeramoeba flamelloides]|eukprot:Anaeramoba_flamelloidesa810327_113.p1 GENE.a810327_113~~a810327_113.p1  ORF type:complete len:175 (-),score=28.74 a810327_113:322-795(-)
MKTAIFGAGCFWGVEESFRVLKGVLKTRVGYTGGTLKNPTYRGVCKGNSGHAEAVKVSFDPELVSYKSLVEHFWDIHDPTTKNRQGYDVGSQYRSVIFYLDNSQKEIATKSKNEQNESGRFLTPIVTEIVKSSIFYNAEEYHQQYLVKQREKYKKKK